MTSSKNCCGNVNWFTASTGSSRNCWTRSCYRSETCGRSYTTWPWTCGTSKTRWGSKRTTSSWTRTVLKYPFWTIKKCSNRREFNLILCLYKICFVFFVHWFEWRIYDHILGLPSKSPEYEFLVKVSTFSSVEISFGSASSPPPLHVQSDYPDTISFCSQLCYRLCYANFQ